ncbi:MAG: His-Xaa-Ser system radical SAM maturase HxsC [Clostridiales Family XIII bacterium]|jgi:His-Xaa-Ser system radical SAM maturase HxsC|nr:His-Xaa-Ser system radical SAM maturase HxsC [Clostridiales Family XIII bacterium]
MLELIGNSYYKFKPLIGKIATKPISMFKRYNRILVTDSLKGNFLGYLAVLTPSKPKTNFYNPVILGNFDEIELSSLNDNDIVKLESDGSVYLLWASNSDQNVLMLTESCDCRCLMCPQPPKAHDSIYYFTNKKILDLLKTEYLSNICITGGEPSLVKSEFIDTTHRCVLEHPEAHIDILTNGKSFANIDFCNEILPKLSKRTFFCISFHSDIDSIHDSIVGIDNSFYKTQAGIYNIAKFGFPIEIRFVINKFNFDRLVEFSDFIYRYFPFIYHLAFMSLEYCGNAEINIDKIYIDPINYKIPLRNAVLHLYRRGINVSIYNTPLCLIHEDVYKFAAKSISQWKNIYLDLCTDCTKQKECSGFFSTSSKVFSEYIQPFL